MLNFEVVQGHMCPYCERIVDHVIGHDDELYCPFCDRRNVEHMMGLVWVHDAIVHARTREQEAKEEMEDHGKEP